MAFIKTFFDTFGAVVIVPIMPGSYSHLTVPPGWSV